MGGPEIKGHLQLYEEFVVNLGYERLFGNQNPWVCAVDVSWCGHVKDPSLRPMAVFPSGPSVAFKRVCAENVHHSPRDVFGLETAHLQRLFLLR